MDISGYSYVNSGASHTHAYIWSPVFKALRSCLDGVSSPRVFEVGCGSGSFANALSAQGYVVTGIDPSVSGIEIARRDYPHLRLELGSTDEELAGRFGRFPAVTSLEVIEHVYAPRQFTKRLFDLLEPRGVAIISTPYNGYLKNLCVALLGQYDKHYTALWDGGHIKFWSIKTLTTLLLETGFEDIQFERVGRIPPLAKSMIAIARKPK